MNELPEYKSNIKIEFINRPFLSSVVISVLAIAYLFLEGCVLSFVSNYVYNTVLLVSVSRIVRIVVALLSLFFYRSSCFDCSGTVKNSIFSGIIMCIPAMLVNIIGLFDATFSCSFLGIINGVAPAVFEEIIWRGIICANLLRLSRASKTVGIMFFVSVLFSLSHVINILFGQAVGSVIIQCLITFGMGAIFTAVYIRTGNLWPVIIVHSLNNIIGNLFSYGILHSLNRYYNHLLVCCLIGLIISVPMVVFALALIRRSTRPSVSKLWANGIWHLSEETPE